MAETDQRSPRILGCHWGRIQVDGHGTMKDAKLYPGGARAWDWRETGTRHDPGIQPRARRSLARVGEVAATTVVMSPIGRL